MARRAPTFLFFGKASSIVRFDDIALDDIDLGDVAGCTGGRMIRANYEFFWREEKLVDRRVIGGALACAAFFGAFLCSPAARAGNPTTTLVISPQSAWETGGDDLAGPDGQSTNAITRIGGSLTQRIGKKWSVTVARSYLDFTLGRVTDAKGNYINPGFIDDAVNNAHIAYALGPVTLSGGWQQRIRWCCPSANTTDANPSSYHFFYLEADTGFGPTTKFGHILSVGVNDAQVPHSNTLSFQDPNYPLGTGPLIPSQGPKNLMTFTGTVTIPIDASQTAAVYGTYANNWEYYLGAPLPYFYNNVTVGFEKTFTPALSYSASLTNYYQHPQGYPFASPNSVNLTMLVMQLNYAINF